MSTNGARHYICPELRNNSTDPADTGITKKVNNYEKLSHFISRMALNGISIAVYCNKDESIYRLVAKKDSLKIRGTRIVELTADEYEKLSCVPDRNIIRFLRAASMCGIDFL